MQKLIEIDLHNVQTRQNFLPEIILSIWMISGEKVVCERGKNT